MWTSLRFRLAVTLVLIVIAVVGSIALISIRVTNQAFMGYVAKDMEQRRRPFEEALVDYYVQNAGWEGVQDQLEQMQSLTGGRVILTDPLGQVVAGSSGELLGGMIREEQHGPAVPLLHEGVVVGVLYIEFLGRGAPPRHDVFLGPANRALLWIALGAGVVAIVLVLGMSGRILSPVEKLTAAVRRMESGDLSQRVEIRSRDEIGELAHAFNAMADGLARLERVRRNMVTDVAHELRTPLTNIRGYLEALQDGLVEFDRAMVDSLYEEAVLLSRLVDDLQELSLAEAGRLHLERQPVAPGDLVVRAAEAVRPRVEAQGITLNVEAPEDLPLVEVDSRRIGQVLRNLLENGLTHTPAGGQIAVSACCRQDVVEFSVQDDGEGIAAGDLPHIFERFYRADPSRSRATGGAGLGLAIAKHLVQLHGGEIGVESSPGEGARFYFTLPVV